MELTKALVYIGAVILLFLGIIFLMASAYVLSRLYIGFALVAISVFIIYFARRSFKMTIIRKYDVDLSGDVTLNPVTCPNCGALLDLKKLEIKAGVPSLNCPYCSKSFEVSEEPKW